MKQAMKLNEIAALLGRFKNEIEILNSNNEYSINRHSEDIVQKLLNDIFDYNLVNINYEQPNAKAIDLYDKERNIIVQVTSTASIAKIKSTIEKVVSSNYSLVNLKLIFVLLSTKQRNYGIKSIKEVKEKKIQAENISIFDLNDIYKEVCKNGNPLKIDQIHKTLKMQFDGVKYQDWLISQKSFQEYKSFILKRYQNIDLRGLSPKIDNSLNDLSLEDIFVNPSLSIENDMFEKPLQDEYQFIDNDNDYDIVSLLNNHSTLVILGDPGAGKSTLLKYISMYCSKNNIDNYLPIKIRLSEYGKYYELNQKDLLSFVIHATDLKYKSVVQDAFNESRLILMLDGLDEINSLSLRHRVVDEIETFRASNVKIKIIVTSRKIGYYETKITNFTHSRINPFSSKQISEFIDKFYTFKKVLKKDLKPKRDKLLTSIERKSIYNLASNPLLLTIIVLISYQGIELPNRRVDLYDIAITTFLDNWVKRRHTTHVNNYDVKALTKLLTPVAYYMYVNYQDGNITEDDFIEQLEKSYICEYGYTDKKILQLEISNILSYIKADAGFLSQKGRDENNRLLYSFVHKTFLEYLAAIEYATKWQEDNQTHDINILFKSRWNEVIVLASEQFRLFSLPRLIKRNTTLFVKGIFETIDNVVPLYRTLILTAAILADNVPIEDTLFKEIINEIVSKVNVNFTIDHSSSIGILSLQKLLAKIIANSDQRFYVITKINDEIINNDNPMNILDVLLMTEYDTTKVMLEIVSEYPNLIEVLVCNTRHGFKRKLLNNKDFTGHIINYLNTTSNPNSIRLFVRKIRFGLNYNDTLNLIEYFANDKKISYINELSKIFFNKIEYKNFIRKINTKYPNLNYTLNEKTSNFAKLNSINLQYNMLDIIPGFEIYKKDNDIDFCIVNQVNGDIYKFTHTNDLSYLAESIYRNIYKNESYEDELKKKFCDYIYFLLTKDSFEERFTCDLIINFLKFNLNSNRVLFIEDDIITGIINFISRNQDPYLIIGLLTSYREFIIYFSYLKYFQFDNDCDEKNYAMKIKQSTLSIQDKIRLLYPFCKLEYYSEYFDEIISKELQSDTQKVINEYGYLLEDIQNYLDTTTYISTNHNDS